MVLDTRAISFSKIKRKQNVSKEETSKGVED